MSLAVGGPRRRNGLPWRWAVWRLPRLQSSYVLAWFVVAVVATGWSVTHQRVASTDWIDVAGLAVLAVGYEEFSRRIERARLGVAGGHHVSMRSVWAFVGAAVLPVSLFALLTAVIYLHAAGIDRRAGGYRAVFNAATMMCSGLGTAAVLACRFDLPVGDTVAAVALVAGAAAAYYLVNIAAVVGWLTIRRGSFDRDDLGTRSENLLELGTLGVGAACALSGNPWAVVLAVPVLYLLQRSALVDELETAATQDAKTGLLNAAAWQAAAERELTRAEQGDLPLAVLVIDLDHFKAVNDRWGHLAGDLVLTQVASCLTSTLRDRDVVGRFGGEEFVAVLPLSQPHEAALVAERIRAAIEAAVATVDSDGQTVLVQVTASIGVAGAPVHGRTLPDLLAAADRAMYGAKEAGRNQVVVGPDDGGAGLWHEPATPAA